MEKITNEQLDSLIKSAVNSSGPLPHDEKFSQIISALRELRTHRNLINERGNFSKSTNHPAHGPVSLDRLHQIREHLQHDTQYSNGGNRAYILSDVLKVIDGAIAAFDAEPAPLQLPVQHWEELCRQNPEMSIGDAIIRAAWWNHCAATLQAGNSPVTPNGWIPVSERMPERDVDV